MALQPHQQRVVDEQQELSGRIQRLTTFAADAKFKALPFAEQARLRRQLIAMEQYDAVLLERIAAFSPGAQPPIPDVSSVSLPWGGLLGVDSLPR